ADGDDIEHVREGIEGISKVGSVSLSSKDGELNNLIDSMGEQGEDCALHEQDNQLTHAYLIRSLHPHDAEEIAAKIEDFEYVHKVVYGEEVVSNLFKFNNYARAIGLALIVGLVLTAVFLISNTIKLTIMARSTEIGVMKLVGATNAFIRWPF